MLFLPLAWFFVIYRAYDPPALLAVLFAALVSFLLAIVEVGLIFVTRKEILLAVVFSAVLLVEMAMIVWLTAVGGWQIHTGP